MTATTTRRGPAKGRYVRVNTLALSTALEFSGMSQRQLAKTAGITQPAISYLTSGARDTCRPETAAKLTKALRLTPKNRDKVFQLVLSSDH